MKFEHWLKKQNKRDDAIGDLARDFILSSSVKKLQSIEKLMALWSPCEGAIKALEAAREEFFDFIGAVTCEPSIKNEFKHGQEAQEGHYYTCLVHR